MNRMLPLFLGIFGTLAFSWAGLTVVPNFQIGKLEPQTDEDGTDAYPMPLSGMAETGRRIFVANGCVYCHSQQVRSEFAASDIDRKWGDRRTAPRDYLFGRPALLGKMRVGPDLTNIGKRAPVEDEAAAPAPSASPAPAASAKDVVTTTNGLPLPYTSDWHHLHLYSPRTLVSDSIMPAYRFLYSERRITGEPSSDAVKLTGEDAPASGWEVVPTYEGKCLVAYLLSLDRSHALKEVKSSAPPSPPAPGKGAK